MPETRLSLTGTMAQYDPDYSSHSIPNQLLIDSRMLVAVSLSRCVSLFQLSLNRLIVLGTT